MKYKSKSIDWTDILLLIGIANPIGIAPEKHKIGVDKQNAIFQKYPEKRSGTHIKHQCELNGGPWKQKDDALRDLFTL